MAKKNKHKEKLRQNTFPSMVSLSCLRSSDIRLKQVHHDNFFLIGKFY